MVDVFQRSYCTLRFFIFSFIFLSSNFSWALSPEEFFQKHEEVTNRYEKISQELGTNMPQKRQKIHHRPISQEKIKLENQLRKIKEEKIDLDQIDNLRGYLLASYLEQPSLSFDENKVNYEAAKIAIGVLGEIKRLRKKYKSFMIPLVHNLFIDIGIKKRGACKHWAEDLLEFLKLIPRDYFFVAWGEHNPQKFSEHNVAVIFPKKKSFEDGVIIDPWRTSGKPFWVNVKDDKKHKWKQWDYYGTY